MSNCNETFTLHSISRPSISTVPSTNESWINVPNMNYHFSDNDYYGGEDGYTVKGLINDSLVESKEVHDYICLIRDEDICSFLKRYGIGHHKYTSIDGKYFIIDKSLMEIFKEAGVDRSLIDYDLYDDWYITGLINEDGSLTYSMIKVREPMDEQQRKAISVVFNSMKIDYIEYAIAKSKEDKISNSMIDVINNQLDGITQAQKNPNIYSKELVDYFKASESDGSYIIAEFAINKVANADVFKNGGSYKLPFEYESFDDFAGKEALDQLERLKIYDKQSNTLSIKDPNKLTQDEKNALLLITTGDKDVYAYAAENQFHADSYDKLPFRKSSSIKSDAGVGEGKSEDGTDWYEQFFKSEDSMYYKKQYYAHGGDK